MLLHRLVVVAVAAAVVAIACLTGDRGAARAAVGQATGPLIGTSLADTAILSAHGLRPGDTKSGEISVQNVGDQAGAFALSSGGVVDGAVGLSGVLDLAVRDITPGREAVLYAGKLGALPSVGLGTLAQGELRRYRFTIALPGDAGNAYQGASASASFVWTASAVGGAPAPAPAPQPAPAPAPAKPPAARPIPGATLSARARQTGARGTVAVTVACGASCKAVLSGTAVDGRTKVRLRTLRWTLAKRTRVRIGLPRRTRSAVARGRRVSVRLRLQATMGTRTVTARTTITVARRTG